MSKLWKSHSKTETATIARKFATTLRGGETITLSGPLGAGKTTFIQALGKVLGVRDVIRSPSFLRLRVYKLSGRSNVKSLALNIRSLVHVDAYRIKSDHELLEAGLDEWFDRPDTIIAIEWPEKIKKLLRHKKLIRLILTPGTNETDRLITIEASPL